ncbi:MAG: RNA methyltransferase [Gemmatimonadota bacterium]
MDRFVVVLHEPRDLVNVALVIRAMKNMGLSRLRLIRPRERLDTRRIQGIAHDTSDLLATTEEHETLDSALADLGFVVGTSARRRSARLRWWSPAEAAADLVVREPTTGVALLFGREDKGLTNRELDRCHAVISIPTDPGHPSLNLAHAALIVFYELRKTATERGTVDSRDLSPKRRRQSPPATAAELESLFRLWEEALETTGFFRGGDSEPKMRSLRSIFQRSELDRRELGLVRAMAYEVIHYVHRARARLAEERREPGGR